MNILELFCGFKGWSTVWLPGNNVVTLDIDKKFLPDYSLDILKINDLSELEIFGRFDVVFASPPCTTFSVASFPQHNYKNLEPLTEKGALGLKIAKHTFNLIEKYKPSLYFIENPRGLMRKFFGIPGKDVPGTTISYCRYGFKIMKPTDLWTNSGYKGYMCRNGNSDHIASPRGSKRGTQGIFDKIRGNGSARSMIPPLLAIDIKNFIFIKK